MNDEHNKGQKIMGPREAEGIKKWQELHRRTIQKFHDPDIHDGMITHLESDILECSQVGLRKHHYEQS